MDDYQDMIRLKERLLAEVESQIESIKQMEQDLNLQAQNLHQELAELRRKREAPAAKTEDDERRNEPRRRGNLLSVYLSKVHGDSGLINGWVVDRSRGGLRVLLDEKMEVGTLLKVCPTVGPGCFNWNRIEVRNCSQEKGSWLLGCRFVQQLSWESLRLFG